MSGGVSRRGGNAAVSVPTFQAAVSKGVLRKHSPAVEEREGIRGGLLSGKGVTHTLQDVIVG